MIIRDEQIQVFQQAAARRFEDEMVNHSKEFAHRHCEVLGEQAVRGIVRLSFQRAERYELTDRGPLRCYLELMWLYGSDFDTDPQLPWAIRTLRDKTIPSQFQRADALRHASDDYLKEVAGPDCEFAANALRRLRETGRGLFAGEDGSFHQTAASRLRWIYPEKCNYLGESGLSELIERGISSARAYSVTSQGGCAVFVGLTFALGQGFAADPQFPWISATLGSQLIPDPNQKAKRVYEKMMVYLDSVVEWLDGRKGDVPRRLQAVQ